jgi:hypothetical protein
MQRIVTGPRRLIGVLLSLALFAGCVDIVKGPAGGLPGDGQIVVTIGSGAERTVSPGLNQFSRITLSFERKDGAGTLPSVEAAGGTALISLTPGTWEVIASAYNAAEPPAVVARAVNTLIRAGDQITGDTHFALAPVGTGPGILRYAVYPPAGISLDGAQSRIRIEQDGAVLESLNSDGFSAGVRPIGGAIAGRTVSLEPGYYAVDIVLDDSASVRTAVYREAALIMPGLVTEVVFSPLAGDFLDPDARAVLTQANGKFYRTTNNSSRTVIGDAGGGEVNRTQALQVPHGTGRVYFTLDKAQSQTVVIGGRDAGAVTQAARNSATDGSTATNTLVVFGVDTMDLAEDGGTREFTLSLADPGKTPVVYAVTLTVAYLTHLHVEWPHKRIYVTGDGFDPAGMALTGVYLDGERKPVTGGWTLEGFDTAAVGEKAVLIKKQGIQAIHYYVQGGVFLLDSPRESSLAINVLAPDARELYFDYGRRRSAEDFQKPDYPDRYTVPIGRTLVLAPVKWHIPDDAVYEWKVDGSTQASTNEYLSFKPVEQKSYAVTVTAKINGQPVSTASTTVECVAPEGTYRPSVTGSPRYELAHAPGQFTPGSGRGYAGVSLGAWGGYIIYRFSVPRGTGNEIEIVGNAFGGWSEPGTVWVMQDENGDGIPNDTWYELAGSHTLLPETKRRYAVTYNGMEHNGAGWTDNLGGIGNAGHYPTGSPVPMTFVGTGLPGSYGEVYYGYVDSYGSQFSIGDAIQVDGTPIFLSYIDFVKVQTGLNQHSSTFGEISTEIKNDPRYTGVPDPAKLLTGTSVGEGEYSYQFVNDSGYDLTITLSPLPQFILYRGTTETKTITNSQAYFDYSGGNVDFARETGKVTFTDTPEENI